MVLEAVKNNGKALLYASEELKSDKEVVLEAIKNNYIALKYSSPDFFRTDEQLTPLIDAIKNSSNYEFESTAKKFVLDTIMKQRKIINGVEKELMTEYASMEL